METLQVIPQLDGDQKIIGYQFNFGSWWGIYNLEELAILGSNDVAAGISLVSGFINEESVKGQFRPLQDVLDEYTG